MKIYPILIASLFVISACNNKPGGPDVSGIKININIERFDKDFFSLDTSHIAVSLNDLNKKYPAFYSDFMQQVLGVSGEDTNSRTQEITRYFIRSYQPLYTELEKKYADISWLQKELTKAFQYVKYYFPDYKNENVVLFIGPLDAPGVALTSSGIAIGLHQFGGKDFPAYLSMEAQQLFPEYISRRFEPQYITANCMKAIIEDIHPDKSGGAGLVEQMIERGKQWWLLDKFLPGAPDSIKTGYTTQQLKWCQVNEGLIWNEIITTQKDLYTKDPMAIQNYIGEAPYTQSMSPVSPGNIGQWVGWQIVNMFADKNPSLTVSDVLKAEPRKILELAKYKPK